MKGYEALKLMDEGKRVRSPGGAEVARGEDGKGLVARATIGRWLPTVDVDDIMQDGWTIIDEPLTDEQLADALDMLAKGKSDYAVGMSVGWREAERAMAMEASNAYLRAARIVRARKVVP